MSSKKFWYFHKSEWVQVYIDGAFMTPRTRPIYYFVDAMSYGRDMCLGATHANTYEGKEAPSFTPETASTSPLGITTKVDISITYTEEKERTTLENVDFTPDYWEAITYGDERTNITLTETILSVQGWDNTHVCGWCEEQSVSVLKDSDLQAVTCICGNTGSFITMKEWMRLSNYDSKPFVGQTKTVNRQGN